MCFFLPSILPEVSFLPWQGLGLVSLRAAATFGVRLRVL